MIERTGFDIDEHEACCDGCGYTEAVEGSFMDAVNMMKSELWLITRDPDDEKTWLHYCPACRGEHKEFQAELERERNKPKEIVRQKSFFPKEQNLPFKKEEHVILPSIKGKTQRAIDAAEEAIAAAERAEDEAGEERKYT